MTSMPSAPTRRTLLGLAAAPFLSPGEALGQGGGVGALRIILPFPPGGPTDAVTRILANELLHDLRRPVIVENKTGGSGTIGTRLALAGKPDGTTLLIGNNQTQATAHFLIRDAGYNPRTDLQPVSGIAGMNHVLVVRKGLGASGVSQLVARAKEAPGKLNYGSTGIGSGSHLGMELFMLRTGARMQHVPFGGAAQMVGEIAAERLDAALAILPAVVGLIEAKSLVALAVAAYERAPQLSAVPTLAQAGVADAEAESWLGLFVDARVPDGTVAQLGGLVRRALARPAVKARIEALGMSLSPRTSDEFRVFQAREIARWGEVIRAIGLQPE